MAAPLLQAQVDVDAPVSAVWALISDLRRMPQWSPQCRWMRPLGALRPGTRTLNLNRRNLLVWPTTSTVVELVPEQKLAFRVNLNNTIWSYELQPIPNGTRLIESRHAENGVKPISSLAVNNFMGGTDSFERELVAGMNQSLAKIKAAAENG
ncbi:SRPBCC family protein [Candidatus Mycobacterium wuenschmannii]|uniref:SRPBCC family protein n=1 Tax=Candidatus Mycobacterium wuenschmannii TaxID=3027808 RepID=A0ABY8VQR6_9MYCO|nr:SRPBCC family protein [Candidatus Mycobacterium wuenschmannii]WIM85980.1 SRPBCC family protein [Candidatus Mycobacterium wuenschmannii]